MNKLEEAIEIIKTEDKELLERLRIMPVPFTDYEYAKFAKLFEETTLSKCTNSHLVLAMYLNVPCSTIKERVRRARKLGLLTQPGKGRYAQTFMTEKAKQLLEEKQ